MTAPLANIFGYIGSTGEYDYLPLQNAGPESLAAPVRLPLTAHDDPNIQRLIDSGIISYTPGKPGDASNILDPSASGSPFVDKTPYSVDVTKLPNTVFGKTVDDVRPTDNLSGFKIINPDLVRYDPNYGNITPKWNLIDPSSQRDMYDMIGPVFAAVLGTAVGIPWYATLGLTAAKTVGAQDTPESTPQGDYMKGVSELFPSGLSMDSPSATPLYSSGTLSSPLDLAAASMNIPELFDPLTDSFAATEKTDQKAAPATPTGKDDLKVEPVKDVGGHSLYSSLVNSNRKMKTLYALLTADINKGS